jgi:HAD superfamily hydrolase (TIGR01509 family)
VTRAVVFDLWETLARWPHEDMGPLFAAVGLTSEEWAAPEHVDRRWTGPFDGYLEWLGLDPAAVSRAGELRRAMTTKALVPMDGALPVVHELGERGLELGLISNCSGDVVELWEESPFGGVFDADAVVLSADVGICKPDERIYRIALERLGVEAEESVFVGDGHSGELAGAEAVGMRAIQIGSYHPWHGERIADLRELLELV